jgi:Integrase core domain
MMLGEAESTSQRSKARATYGHSPRRRRARRASRCPSGFKPATSGPASRAAQSCSLTLASRALQVGAVRAAEPLTSAGGLASSSTSTSSSSAASASGAQGTPPAATRGKGPRARDQHIRTRPNRPRANGEAKRFIGTPRAGWAYGAIDRSFAERRPALSGRLDFCNGRRPHGSPGDQVPWTG